MIATIYDDALGTAVLYEGENTEACRQARLACEAAAALLAGGGSPVNILASLAGLTGAAGRMLAFTDADSLEVVQLGAMLALSGGVLSAKPAVHALMPIASGLYYLPTVNSANMATFTLTAGKMDFIPFVPGTSFTCDRIELEVTTAVASSSVHVGVYADNGSGNPGALIDGTTTALDSTTTGIKNSAAEVSVNFVAGTVYWLGVLPSHAIGVRAMGPGSQMSLLQIAAGMANQHGWLRATQTFGALPSTAAAIDMSNAINGSSCAMPRLRKA